MRLKVIRREAGEPLLRFEVVNRELAAIEGDDPPAPQIHQHAIDVNWRECGRVRNVRLRERQVAHSFARETTICSPREDLAQQVSHPLQGGAMPDVQEPAPIDCVFDCRKATNRRRREVEPLI